MDIAYKTRNFHPDELRLLKTLKNQKEKEGHRKTRCYHYVIAAVLGAGLAYITAIIPDSFWTFLLGTLAVFAFAFIVFTPYEMYKLNKQRQIFLRQLSSVMEKGTVDTCRITASRIAIAPEYEDESDLYIVELNESEVLYLWDTEYNWNKKFPCLDFEIYEKNFLQLIGRQIYPLSERIIPVKIDKKTKWNYMDQYGVFGHLAIENINFDKLLEKYNNCA